MEIPFITCKRRKNQPKISPLICEQRCPRVKGCQEYFDYIQPAMFERYARREAKGKADSISVQEDSHESGSSGRGENSKKRRK